MSPTEPALKGSPLLELPTELLQRIIHFALPPPSNDEETLSTRYALLRSLCLVNQLGCDLAQPELFKWVYLKGRSSRQSYEEARSQDHIKDLPTMSVWIAMAEGDPNGSRDFERQIKASPGMKKLQIDAPTSFRSVGDPYVLLEYKNLEELVLRSHSFFDTDAGLFFRKIRRLALDRPQRLQLLRRWVMPKLVDLAITSSSRPSDYWDTEALDSLAPQLKTFSFCSSYHSVSSRSWRHFSSLEHLIISASNLLPDPLRSLPHQLQSLRMRADESGSLDLQRLLFAIRRCPPDTCPLRIVLPAMKTLAPQTGLALNSQLLAEEERAHRTMLAALCQEKEIELRVLPLRKAPVEWLEEVLAVY